MKHYNIVTIKDPKNDVTEAYRKLQVNIDYSSIDNKYQAIMVTSSAPEEGKTLTALNLAAVYAEKKKKVIIVDMDLRKPKIHRAVNMRNTDGLTDYVVNGTPLEKLIKKTDIGFDIINSGSKVPYPNVLLESDSVKELMKELRKNYDYIIVDTPPVAAVTDPIIIGRFVDGIVFTIASRKTKKDLAKEMISQLKKNGGNIIGINLTQVSKKDDGKYSGYYYYGYDE